MADNKGNIFKRIGKKISDVFAELKRVTWPTGEKLAKTAAVVGWRCLPILTATRPCRR